VITPPFFRRQRVFNRHTRLVRRYEMRDAVDVEVLHQTFLEEQYRLKRLARFESIQRRYDALRHDRQMPLIIDCGANIGLSAAYFADQFPAAKVVAVEPEPGNVAQARTNCPNAVLIQAAVSAQCGRGSVVDVGKGGWAFRVIDDRRGDVEFVSINELLERHAECAPFIVKIDIEGFESELFASNTQWVDRFALIIVELHDWMLPGQRTSANFLRTIAGLDRDFVYIGENIFSIANNFN
jgi:FkbM family methyltransferase